MKFQLWSFEECGVNSSLLELLWPVVIVLVRAPSMSQIDLLENYYNCYILTLDLQSRDAPVWISGGIAEAGSLETII